jgi:hypothetical protein
MSEWSSFTTHKVVRCVLTMVHTYHQLKYQLIQTMPTPESIKRCTSKRMRTGGDKLTTLTSVPRDLTQWAYNERMELIHHPQGCEMCTHYGTHISSAELQLILTTPTPESVERCTSKRMRIGGDKLTILTVSFQRWKKRSVDYRGNSTDWSSSSRITQATTEDVQANARVTNNHSSPVMDPIKMRHQRAGRRWCPKLGPLLHTPRQRRQGLQHSRMSI